jgi:hypothetical protein
MVISLIALASLLVSAGSAWAISAPIHIAGTDGEGVFIRPEPNTSRPAIGWIPEGASPDYNCFAWGQNVGGVPIWFNVNYNGVTGYYASFYDDSSYHSNEELTAKYGVPLCGSTPPPAPSSGPPPTTSPAPAPPTPAPQQSGGSGQAFPVMHADGGIYWRASPSWGSAIAKAGNGFYPGTTVRVSCSASGSAVPGSANTMWVQAVWVAGPGRGGGWINEHFLNDGAPINQAAAGVPPCNAATRAPLTVGCYGDYCSGKDPKQTGCSAGAQTLASKDMSGARLELRWSAVCKTEWARWIQYPIGFKSDLPMSLAAVQDTGYTKGVNFDVNGKTENPAASQQSGGITTSWTSMIYSPVHKVKAVATVQCGDSGLLGSAVDCAVNGKVETAAR